MSGRMGSLRDGAVSYHWHGGCAGVAGKRGAVFIIADSDTRRSWLFFRIAPGIPDRMGHGSSEDAAVLKKRTLCFQPARRVSTVSTGCGKTGGKCVKLLWRIMSSGSRDMVNRMVDMKRRGRQKSGMRNWGEMADLDRKTDVRGAGGGADAFFLQVADVRRLKNGLDSLHRCVLRAWLFEG